ncbi:MAG: hypothetical protein ACOYMN_21290 [Roseimicrobium sp.]
MKRTRTRLLRVWPALLAGLLNLAAEAHPDALTLPPDLEDPVVALGEPAPGKLVRQTLPAYAGTEVAHTLYLPSDWSQGQRYPVLIEYRGNRSRVCDVGGMGYAISGGKGFIWAVLPFISTDGQRDMELWWGDVAATVAYAKAVVPQICQRWGGDPAQVVLIGHSRGAIACNYIGLHDAAIAQLWRAMIPFSHYDDGHAAWGMTPEEQRRAPERLRRLGSTPQFICGEHTTNPHRGSDATLREAIRAQSLTTFAAAQAALGLVPLTEVEGTRKFLAQHHPAGRFTLVDFPNVNHAASVLLRDTAERRQLRQWLQHVLPNPPGSARQSP